MMGAALAEALLNADHTVTVWNRSAEKIAPLTAKGAHAAASVQAAMAASEITIICVSDHAATTEILNAAEAGPGRDALLVVMTSMSPKDSREIADWAARHRVGYLEGTIFGVPDDIVSGNGMIVYSGPSRLFEANEPLLKAMSPPKYLSEDIGSAVSFDRVYYVFGYGLFHAFLVGAAMAHAKGFSIDTYTDVVMARSPVFVDRLKGMGDAIANRDHDVTQASIERWAAGFENSLTMCREAGVDDALPAAIKRYFDRALAAGYGGKEMTAVFEVLIDNAGGRSS
jgi:3-hydroxyisobutyrate dehydrogenase-like beta-hydroxyacid dehydrogenase